MAGIIYWAVTAVAAVLWVKLVLAGSDDIDGLVALPIVLFAPIVAPFVILLYALNRFAGWLTVPVKKPLKPSSAIDDSDLEEGYREIEDFLGKGK
jgi:hypothetical protein